ncbi:rpn2_yeast 26S proteasome regulatory subunit rpn2, putative [Babesia bigemina]|uniref:Rpn2_yeast 26S proteasome regulatory subunit rpn2, putative n=1 Tax=Babesia bigemina TaxID=5866 RepID=A0A061D4L5_BABBI|nr:rpn2_yeast 26S proteasome regulatory subunit rpn2, putative [Babesia bigemina]CDR94992.1 rpn2_yeast 26S proteasome regulatory subunit rpn2, putative [Babesia bigemina]|eukprot:XP_012767178.1 rpn2_yeast 26S proteasome regulatory subunit rpn2, putative [Babesia bigemina]
MLLDSGSDDSARAAAAAGTAPSGEQLLTRISSAEPVLALLHERDDASRELGLLQLDSIVDTFWPEIADSLPTIEYIYEDPHFRARELAALVASKVYFNLQDYAKALHYALAAGDRFDPQGRSEYANIIVAKAVDEYIRARQEAQDGNTPRSNSSLAAASQEPLEALVTRLIAMSVESGDEHHAIGIALDARRLDLLLRILKDSANCCELVSYTMGLMDGVLNPDFCAPLYDSIRDILLAMPKDMLANQYPNLVTCLYKVNNHEQMAQLLLDMVKHGDHLQAYQICYDLVDIGDQKFLKALKESPILSVEGNFMVERVKRILSGTSTTELHLQFLHRKNHTDLLLLEHYMNSVDQRNSVAHNAVVLAHAIMQAGTCCDVFLRDNLNWLAKANNWAKFTATASIGVVHKGYVKHYKKVLASYLPGETPNSSHAYSEGGSLYATGLMLSNRFDPEAAEMMLGHLRNDSAEEALHHGAALGLGLVCMGQCDPAIYEELKATLYRNSAVSGQAAAIAIGLLMMGSGNLEVLDTLYAFCSDTQHEKIVRACALAISMVLYRCEKNASIMIGKLTHDNDPVVRYGGMFTYAMAYCGTGSSKALKELLYAAVSDVSDDVRRAAVIALGFVLCNTPEEVPKVLKLLVASYNPHVRYGAAIALGISCAAFPQPDVVRLLHSLSSDRSDFVRQGAFIALGLVLQQSNAETSNDVMQVRDLFRSVASEKHQDIIAKFGAIVGAGLMDAGGQNCVASLYTGRGNMRREAVVGFLMFAQYWYWHSFMHFVCLTFQPTCLIGINNDLQIPTGYKVLCTAPPKTFDYVPHITDEPSEQKKAEVTAVLSISAKRRAWLTNARSSDQLGGKGDKGESKSGVDGGAAPTSERQPPGMEASSAAGDAGQPAQAAPESGTADLSGDVVMANGDEQGASSALGASAGEKAAEQSTGVPTLLENPCRLIPRQAAHCSVPPGSRYVPAFPERRQGIVLLRDCAPGEPEEYVACESEQPEAPPFTPFEYKG